MSDWERVIFESLTDEDLRTPIRELPDGKIVVLQHVLRGPFGQELMDRIDALDGPGEPE
jgi:hypothetical protein